jgi:hypothetical protein
MAMHNQITGNRIVVLPLLIERCEIPLFLKPKLYADFSDNKKYSFALEQLLQRLGVPIQVVVVTSADLQELLDRIPQPKRQDFFSPGRTNEEKVAFVVDNGIDLTTLEAQTPWERAKVYSALEQLIRQHRLEIFLLRGRLAGGHPDIKEGTPFVLPIVYKGTFPPELRPSQAELDSFLKTLRVGQ